MKMLYIFLSLTCSLNAISQTKKTSIYLAPDIKLTSIIERFNPVKHKLDTCALQTSYTYICAIDGKKWYGGDEGLELPRTQLKQLIIHVDGNAIPLNILGMFNPSFELMLRREQFKIVRKKTDYFLYGYFSDGAGTYTAHWKIWNGKSERLKISTEEKDFYWQTDSSAF